VINGFLDLILAVFGPEIGRHARSASPRCPSTSWWKSKAKSCWRN